MVPSPSSPSFKSAATPFQILRNAVGHRIDPPLGPRPSNSEIAQLKAQRVCTDFYLLGQCGIRARGTPCPHAHLTILSAREIATLRFVVRQENVCSNGLACDDPSCIHGHRCSYGDRCRPPRGDGVGDWKCQFPSEMHRVDTKVVNVVEPTNSLKRRRAGS